MTTNWTIREIDARIVRDRLQGWLPERVFDAHAHLYRVCDLGSKAGEFARSGPEIAGYGEWRARMTELLGPREFAGFFFPMPSATVDVAAANSFLAGELAGRKDCRRAMLASPSTSAAEIASAVAEFGFRGIKGYHLLCPQQPAMQAPIADYLTEEHFAAAHELGLVVVLHMVKDRALADPANSGDIRRLCVRHPRMKLLLAHAGRCFNPLHAEEGMVALDGLRNVWFDSSAVCESASLEIVLRRFGPERLLYGSDFPVAFQRGRCVAVGDGFIWLTGDWHDWKRMIGAPEPSLVGVESLLALQRAMDARGFGNAEKELIFGGNAEQLFAD
ncbi:MAG TPA: amidohydrolase family protein [Candidatus Brocadiia bacterium]|nr:amidohydrolase family protein [Candidatus Brocadiia bacterium]